MKRWLVVLAAFLASGAGPDPKRSDAADARAQSLRRDIGREVKRLGAHDPWAGAYYYGDGLGVNVTFSFAPTAGFLFEWHGCLGLYDRNFGSVTREGDRVRLIPELPNSQKGFQGTPLEFTSVRWGPRRYLVASDGLLEFCNAVNSGAEPRGDAHGAFLLHEGDESLAVTGPPTLPHEYQSCILETPISARIIHMGASVLKPSLGDFKFRVTPVTLDAGSADGVWQGMKFELTAPKTRYESATVKRVYDRESEAEIREIGTEESPPEVGWMLATRRER
jgi:hypothetical protein